MQARSGILASHLNSQTHLNQFSIELVKSSTEAENTVFANCSALKLDSLHILRQQQTKKRFNRIMDKSEHCLHYLLYVLPETRLLLTDCDLPTN